MARSVSKEGLQVVAADIVRELATRADSERAQFVQRYFKTGPGEYAEGDRFLGVKVPDLRSLSRRYWQAPLAELEVLLVSEVHEERQLALFCLVERHRREPSNRGAIHEIYMTHLAHVNNWDLVDASAEHLLGSHIAPSDLSVLDALAEADSVWLRRISIMATFHHIKQGIYEPTLHVADRLLADRHDLIHKAVGWMLREVGNRDRAIAESFLRSRYRHMPRTMLRYAIEKYPETRRREYLAGTVG